MRIADLRRFNLDTLIVLKGVLSLLKDPTQTESVYDIEDGMKHSEAMANGRDFNGWRFPQMSAANTSRTRYTARSDRAGISDGYSR
jgi:hypothetical protein